MAIAERTTAPEGMPWQWGEFDVPWGAELGTIGGESTAWQGGAPMQGYSIGYDESSGIRGEVGVAAAFAAALIAQRASEVESVVVTPGTTAFTVWTVMDDPDEEMRRRVYRAETAFYDRQPGLSVHFRLLRRRGRPLEQLAVLPSGCYRHDMRGDRARFVLTSATGAA